MYIITCGLIHYVYNVKNLISLVLSRHGHRNINNVTAHLSACTFKKIFKQKRKQTKSVKEVTMKTICVTSLNIYILCVSNR